MSLRIMRLFNIVNVMLGEPGAAMGVLDWVVDDIDYKRSAPAKATPVQIATLSSMPLPRRGFCRARMCLSDEPLGRAALAAAVSSAGRAARPGS